GGRGRLGSVRRLDEFARPLDGYDVVRVADERIEVVGLSSIRFDDAAFDVPHEAPRIAPEFHYAVARMGGARIEADGAKDGGAGHGSLRRHRAGVSAMGSQSIASHGAAHAT